MPLPITMLGTEELPLASSTRACSSGVRYTSPRGARKSGFITSRWIAGSSSAVGTRMARSGTAGTPWKL